MSDQQKAGRPDVSPGLSLGRIAGIPVVLAWSWFVITVFIVLVFGPRVSGAFPGIGTVAYLVALGYALLLAASVLAHELAHALTARAFGWPTTRIVLNLWGGHTQFASFNASPGRSLAVALAGPAANFVLAGLGWTLLQAMAPGSVAYLLVTILVWANVLVAVFNVLPVAFQTALSTRRPPSRGRPGSTLNTATRTLAQTRIVTRR